MNLIIHDSTGRTFITSMSLDAMYEALSDGVKMSRSIDKDCWYIESLSHVDDLFEFCKKYSHVMYRAIPHQAK